MDLVLAIGLTICTGGGECYLTLESLELAKVNMLTFDPFSSTLTPCSRDWSDGGVTSCWLFDSGPEEAFFMEPFENLGAIGMIESRNFGNLVVPFLLEVCFTISLRLLATALPFSPSFIQSGFGPKP